MNLTRAQRSTELVPAIVEPRCQGTRLPGFFPEEIRGARRKTAAIAEAVALCADCPSATPCLTARLDLPEKDDRHGIWGGRTAGERTAIRLARGGVGMPSPGAAARRPATP